MEKIINTKVLNNAGSNIFIENDESDKLTSELIKKLAFQLKEKKKRAAELLIANRELVFQNMEKEKRAEELIIANKELSFQNDEKGKRAKEYSILNKKLIDSLKNTKKINKELTIAKVKAEESDNLKSAFLANMSHEIRTPMNAIMGFSNLLLEKGLVKEKIENYVKIINASGLQLLTIISDIIDISKIESGQVIIEYENININTLMNDIYITYNKITNLKKIKLSFSCKRPNDNLQIKTDGNRIKQVLCNLLNNALKFTKQGQINFGYVIKGSTIEFFVKDTGIGIAPENQDLIFNRFRQVDVTSTRIYGGNGLGLSISKALVEKLGGSMTVHSQLGEGSIFTFTIPYEKVVLDTLRNNLSKNSNQNFLNKHTILLVEDEINNHAYLEELFTGINFKIIHAWNGKEAVEKVKKHSEIALVLMDIKMPIMDGNEAIKLIKQIRPELPVIAQTAFALSHNRKQALEAGFDNYISKPLLKDPLMKVISCYLN